MLNPAATLSRLPSVHLRKSGETTIRGQGLIAFLAIGQDVSPPSLFYLLGLTFATPPSTIPND